MQRPLQAPYTGVWGPGDGQESEEETPPFPPRTTGRPFISMKELAQELSVHPTTVRRLLSAAGVRAYFLSDKLRGTVRYRLADVKAWLENSRA